MTFGQEASLRERFVLSGGESQDASHKRVYLVEKTIDLVKRPTLPASIPH